MSGRGRKYPQDEMELKRWSSVLVRRPLPCAFTVLLAASLFRVFFQWGSLGSNRVDFLEAVRTGSPVESTRSGGPGKFYLLPIPELTTLLIRNNTNEASRFYQDTLDEQQAEIWLHRAFEQMTYEEGRTRDPSQADVVLITGYLHLNAFLLQKSGKLPKKRRKGKPTIVKPHPPGIPFKVGEWIDMILSRIVDKSKPHVLMVPTWNAGTSRQIGIAPLMKQLQASGVNTWSLGFERNTFWQHVTPERIITVPYMVKPDLSQKQLAEAIDMPRTMDFTFYSGDTRKHAFGWSGCNRSMVLPLANRTDMDVRIVTSGKGNRLPQDEYNRRMLHSDYCLLLCGDTPTSRSLAASMLHGCIPIRVGARLRGLCESPCRPGWGWTVSGARYPHLPFSDRIDWTLFPEVNETEFSNQPAATLHALFRRIGSKRKQELRSIMRQVQHGWMYGLGDPLNSSDFGEAAVYIWESIVNSVVPAK